LVDILAALSYAQFGGTEMNDAKKTMTLNLSEAEMRVLDNLAMKKDLSKTAVVRQALRLYQMIEVRLEAGEKLIFEDERAQKKAELMVL
jgi:predicted transcriptional regulator